MALQNGKKEAKGEKAGKLTILLPDACPYSPRSFINDDIRHSILSPLPQHIPNLLPSPNLRNLEANNRYGRPNPQKASQPVLMLGLDRSWGRRHQSGVLVDLLTLAAGNVGLAGVAKSTAHERPFELGRTRRVYAGRIVQVIV